MCTMQMQKDFGKATTHAGNIAMELLRMDHASRFLSRSMLTRICAVLSAARTPAIVLGSTRYKMGEQGAAWPLTVRCAVCDEDIAIGSHKSIQRPLGRHYAAAHGLHVWTWQGTDAVHYFISHERETVEDDATK